MHVVLRLNYHRLDHLAPLFQALYNRFPDGDMQFEQVVVNDPKSE